MKISNFKFQISNSWRSQVGFTYIELVLYIAIVAIVMSALIPFAWNIIEGGSKSATQQEVFSQARYVSERLKYEIRNATGINSVAPTSISLSTATAGTNPTIIDLSGGVIQIKQGSGGAIALNSTDTTVPSLTFTNYTSSGNETQNIQFVFTILANNSGGSRQEFNASTTVEGSAEVRSN